MAESGNQGPHARPSRFRHIPKLQSHTHPRMRSPYLCGRANFSFVHVERENYFVAHIQRRHHLDITPRQTDVRHSAVYEMLGTRPPNRSRAITNVTPCNPSLYGPTFVRYPGKINRPDTLRQLQRTQSDLEYWWSAMLPAPDHAKAAFAILVRQNQNVVFPDLTGQPGQADTIPADVLRDCVFHERTPSLAHSAHANRKEV